METLLNVKLTQVEADFVCMDFRKAFDWASYVGLLQKLLNIGITGSLWQWLRAYLKYRHQYVKIRDCSDFCNVLSGVPQGSVHGPLLFAIFINDLHECILSSIPFLFADDTKSLQITNSLSDINCLQEDINNISHWSYNTLQWSKIYSSLLLAKSYNSSLHIDYTINGKPILQKSIHKDLGINFTNNLQWSEYHKTIAPKALGLLHRIFKTNNIQVKKQFTYILSDLLLLPTLEASSNQRYSDSGTHSTKGHKIHIKWLWISLQIPTWTATLATTNVYVWAQWSDVSGQVP